MGKAKEIEKTSLSYSGEEGQKLQTSSYKKMRDLMHSMVTVVSNIVSHI